MKITEKIVEKISELIALEFFHVVIVLLNIVAILCGMFCFVVVMSSGPDKTNFRKRFLMIIFIGVYGLIGRTVFQIGIMERSLTPYTYHPGISDQLSHLIMESGCHSYLIILGINCVFLTRVIFHRNQKAHVRKKKFRLLLGWWEWGALACTMVVISVMDWFPSLLWMILRHSVILPLLALNIGCIGMCGWALVTHRTNNPARVNGVCFAVLLSLTPYFIVEALLIPVYGVTFFIPRTSSVWGVLTVAIDIARLVFPGHVAMLSLLVAGDLLYKGKIRKRAHTFGGRATRMAADGGYASLVS